MFINRVLVVLFVAILILQEYIGKIVEKLKEKKGAEAVAAFKAAAGPAMKKVHQSGWGWHKDGPCF